MFEQREQVSCRLSLGKVNSIAVRTGLEICILWNVITSDSENYNTNNKNINGKKKTDWMALNSQAKGPMAVDP